MPPRERFQSVVRKVMAMHRGTSMMVTGLNVGAEPGIDPRRASADLMFGGIKKRCVIEMFDYSSTNCMAGNDDEDEDDRIKFMTDSETIYGGTVNSRWSLKKGGTLRSRTRQQTGGSEKDMEMGVLNKTRSNGSWSFFDSDRKEEEARVAALKKGDRVQVQVQPMFIFLFRDGNFLRPVHLSI
ncbi:hypothetical protein K435DRAFT_789111 [Dendrothele bispora CBS 962.96]|uniref:Uncharacterized protein n=1 Tax=Dendrothele bispora (strain CBS 962.96) TaxID=1314807 RepID=A0A4S8MUU1_DENBC|nr:hypothetical protein K435DRAFT_789111 [Dendrothele bispora CBS 962.96]